MLNNSILNCSSMNPYSPSLNASEAQGSQQPSFLFGSSHKRKSLALTGNNPYLNSPLQPTTAPSTDIFASPLPSHIKDAQSANKNVHWSPHLTEELFHEKSLTRSSPRVSAPSFGSKGPPLRSLRDEIEPPQKTARISSTSQFKSPTEENSEMDTWVTVFGFPPDYSDRILKLFSRHGEIVQHKFASRGNWVHLRYSCVVHAKQALTRNASVLDGSVRIGVVSCSSDEVSLLNRSALNATISPSLDGSSIRTPITPYRDPAESSFASPVDAPRTASRAGLRPLAALQETNSYLRDDSRSGGIMNKLWNYMSSGSN